MSTGSALDTYDMVVALSQKTINNELNHLRRMRMIPAKLTIQRTSAQQGQGYVYKRLDSAGDLPTDGDGNPLVECITGRIRPGVAVLESGTSVMLAIEFTGGEAWLMTDGKLQRYEMEDWQYSVEIDLNLAALAEKDLEAHKAIPDLVKKQLKQFQDNYFTVNNLFVDLESVDLMKPIDRFTNAGNAGQAARKALIEFVAEYLKSLKKTDNPFILGYPVTTDDTTKFDEHTKVPDSLRPTGVTFSTTHDDKNPHLSTVNLLLVTKGGAGKIQANAPVTHENWLRNRTDINGRMAFSREVLVEDLILKPIFESMQQTLYNQLSDHMDLGSRGPSYQDGRGVVPGGLGFALSNVDKNHDKYTNFLHVAYANKEPVAVLSMSGEIVIKKIYENDYGVGIAKIRAKATIEGTINWDGSVSLSATKDKDGEPVLSPVATSKLRGKMPDFSPKLNTTAVAISFFGSALDKFLKALNMMGWNNLTTDAIDEALNYQLPDFGSVADAIGAIGTVSSMFVLPGGDTFAFKDPELDPNGHLMLTLTYESSN